MASHEILGGKVQLYRRTNKIWHCSASVGGVQHRASTKEEDLELAKEAAVFAPVVWTNIFYPNVLGLIGDFISGPVGDLLGKGIRDIRVPIGSPGFRHLDYWKHPKSGGPAIRALRRALNFKGHTEAVLWGNQVNAELVEADLLAPRITQASQAHNDEGAIAQSHR